MVSWRSIGQEQIDEAGSGLHEKLKMKSWKNTRWRTVQGKLAEEEVCLRSGGWFEEARNTGFENGVKMTGGRSATFPGIGIFIFSLFGPQIAARFLVTFLIYIYIFVFLSRLWRCPWRPLFFFLSFFVCVCVFFLFCYKISFLCFFQK